jgi:hypothetical protein
VRYLVSLIGLSIRHSCAGGAEGIAGIFFGKATCDRRLYSIQQTSSRRYLDSVLGWHMSAAENDLSYFRFDGTCYQRIGTATHLTDEGGAEKIIPKPDSGVAGCKLINARVIEER